MLNKFTAACGLGSVVLCIGSMTLAHKEVVSANVGAGLFLASGVLGLLSLCGVALVLIYTKHYPVALLGVVGLMPLVAAGSALGAAFQHPRIFDVSTDTARVPDFVAALQLPENAGRGMTFPPENAARIAQGYPELEPLLLNLSPEQAYARAVEVAGQMKNWTLDRQDTAKLEFEGVAATKLFRWKSDFIVRVLPADGGRSKVDMRARSREEQSDLGANARWIRGFFKELRQYDLAVPNPAG